MFYSSNQFSFLSLCANSDSNEYFDFLCQQISWNPNIGRFFWLASGHQCGIIRITGMHFMENEAIHKFLKKAAELVKQS